jgi:tetratricopeptide (TPR) repeat protein
VQFVIEAARRTGRHMSPQAASAYWTREVLRIAAEHPATFAGKLFQKMLAFLNRFEAGDHYHAGFIGDPVPFFRLPFFSFWLVFPLGMAGMLLRLGDCTNSRALFMVFMLYGLTLVAFVVGARYRLPALTILIPFAAAGLIRCAGLLRNRQHRKMGVYGLLVLAFGLVEVLPVRGAGDLTPYYNTHAVVLDAAGRTKEAIGYWEASSDMNGSFSPVSRLYLAGKYYPMGRRTEALRLIERIPADSFAAAAKYSLLGDLMRHEKKFTEAAAAYEKSLEINSGQSRIRRALIAIYRRSGKGKVFEEYRKLQEIRAYFDGKKPLQP